MHLPQLFERNASASPDAIAITSEGHRLSYRDLNAGLNRSQTDCAKLA